MMVAVCSDVAVSAVISISKLSVSMLLPALYLASYRENVYLGWILGVSIDRATGVGFPLRE